MNARRTLVGLVSLTTAVMLIGAPSALAKPGGSSGSHSSSSGSHSGSSGSGSGSKSGSSGSGSKTGSTGSGSGSGSGSGRSVQAPVNSNKSTTKNTTNTTNNSNTGTTRKVQAPTNSNNTTVPGLKGVKNPPTTTYTVPQAARAKGKTYTVPGTHTSYTYNRTVYSGYYSTYHGGYPLLGTALYFSLLNDPFYYPNYSHFGSPWYGHAYPTGYLVSDNQLVPVAHKSHALLIFGIIVGALILIGLAAWILTSIVGRRKQAEEERPFANQF